MQRMDQESIKGLQLFRAVKRGQISEVRRLLDEMAPPNEDVQQGWTPLFAAASRGDTRVLRLLIEHGADVNLGLESGFTALFGATLMGHLEAAQLLLDSRASPLVGADRHRLSTYAPEGACGKRIRELLRRAEAAAGMK